MVSEKKIRTPSTNRKPRDVKKEWSVPHSLTSNGRCLLVSVRALQSCQLILLQFGYWRIISSFSYFFFFYFFYSFFQFTSSMARALMNYCEFWYCWHIIPLLFIWPIPNVQYNGALSQPCAHQELFKGPIWNLYYYCYS